jgi:hypothetical protein
VPGRLRAAPRRFRNLCGHQLPGGCGSLEPGSKPGCLGSGEVSGGVAGARRYLGPRRLRDLPSQRAHLQRWCSSGRRPSEDGEGAPTRVRGRAPSGAPSR